MTRSLPLALGLALASCSRQPPPPSPAPHPVAPRSAFTVHEWGLFGFELGRASVEAASGTRPLIPGGGLGLSGTGTGKPVIYVHLDPGTDEAELSLSIGLPAPRVAEHHPFGAVEPTRLSFGRFRARRGACGDARTPPSCRPGPNGNDSDDGYCEAAEIPRYHGDDDVCLRSGAASGELLFYRGRALEGVAPPLALLREGDGYALAPGRTPIEGPVYFVERRSPGTVLYRALEANERSGPIALDRGLVDVAAVRASLLAHARTLGLTEREADAFVDAWAPAFFDACHRQGPEAEGAAPTTLAASDASLLYFAPRAMIDATIPLTIVPPAREVHRAFLVRVVDGARASRPMDAPAGTYGLGNPLGFPGHGEDGFDDTRVIPPRVQLEGRPVVQGGISADAVRRVVVRNLMQVRFCYEQQLARDASLQGVATIAFDVGPTGSVVASSVERTTVGDAVADCTARATRRWAFPVPTTEGVTRVRVTFRFTYSQ